MTPSGNRVAEPQAKYLALSWLQKSGDAQLVMAIAKSPFHSFNTSRPTPRTSLQMRRGVQSALHDPSPTEHRVTSHSSESSVEAGPGRHLPQLPVKGRAVLGHLIKRAFCSSVNNAASQFFVSQFSTSNTQRRNLIEVLFWALVPEAALWCFADGL